MADVKAFDDLLEKTIRASRLSGSKVKELSEMANKLVKQDHHLVTSLLRLNTSLPPASISRISSLYVFDAIARAIKSGVNKANGKEVISTERGKGTHAGLLAKMEGVVDSWIDGMVDDGKGGVWIEGRDKTRKVIDIWGKGNTFPQACLAQLSARIAAAVTPPAGATPPPLSPGLPPLEPSQIKAGPSKLGRSSTPPFAPPPHVVASYTSRASGSTPPVSSAGLGVPGQLPPEIAALLGVGAAAEAEKSEAEAAIDALLANVRSATATKSATPAPIPTPVLTNATPTPFPTLPILDPAQLAALANIAALAGPGAQASTSSAPALPPVPSSSTATQQQTYSSGGYERYDRGPPVPPRAALPPGRFDGDRGGRRSRSPDRERAWRREPRDGYDAPRKEPWNNRESGWQENGHSAGQGNLRDVRQDRFSGSGYQRPPQPVQSSRPSGRAALPPKPGTDEFGRELPPGDSLRETLEVRRAGDLGGMDGTSGGGMVLPQRPLPVGLPARPNSSESPTRAGLTRPPLPAPVSAHSSTTLPIAAAPVPPPVSTLASFDLNSFNPMAPESWAALATAWKGSTGREPNQLELMHFLSTGEAPNDSVSGGGAADDVMTGGVGRGMGGGMAAATGNWDRGGTGGAVSGTGGGVGSGGFGFGQY